MLSWVALHSCFRPDQPDQPPTASGGVLCAQVSCLLYAVYDVSLDTAAPGLYLKAPRVFKVKSCFTWLVIVRTCLSAPTCSGLMMGRRRWSLCCVMLALAASSMPHEATARSLLTSNLQTSLRGLTQATTSAATSPLAEFVRNGGPVPSKGDVAAASKHGRPGYPKKKDNKLYLYAWYVPEHSS